MTFPFEAAATLATGLAAVGVGYVVSRNQTRILNRQVLAQELSLRNDLFERRLEAYQIIRRYVGLVSQGASYDEMNHRDFLPFYEAVENLRFLFSKNLRLEVMATQAFVREYLDREDYLMKCDPDDPDRLEIDTDQQHLRLLEIKRRFDSMPALFGAEMALTHDEGGFQSYVNGPDVDDVDTPGTLKASADLLRRGRISN